MPGHKRPMAMNNFKLKEVSMQGPDSLSRYIDHKWMYEAFGDYKNDEVLRVAARTLAVHRPTFIGDQGDVMEILGKRVTKKTTTKDFISVEVELPSQKRKHARIVRVDCANNVKKLGYAGTTFEMTVEDANLSTKNFYSLRDCPNIILKVVSEFPKTDGVRGFKYTWKVYGEMDDYVYVKDLKNGELINMGSHMEEAALTRGTVSMGGMGKAYACYRFPLTRSGFEVQITDLAWRTGKYWTAQNDACKHDDMKRMMFSDIETNFHFAAESAYENWLLWGKAPSIKAQQRFTDPTTRRPYNVGPSFLDYLRSAGGETYNCHNFNIDKILARIQRAINKSSMSNAEKGRVVVDVITGTGGFTEKILPELQRKDPGCSGCDGLYEEEEGFSPGRKTYSLGNRSYRSIRLEPFGKVKFHISKTLDDGVLSGRKEYKGWPLSSYWMIIMIGQATGESETSSAVQIWENKAMERRGYKLGDWSPSGPTNTEFSRGSKYVSHDGTLGNSYKIIQDFYKGIFVPDFNNLHILYPNF